MAADGGATIRVHGVAVKFPFKPYRPQVQLMTAVLGALTQSANALLESPTGTGKTLSLLCAALAWQETSRGENEIVPIGEPGAKRTAAPAHMPRIFYCTRTHLQIAQVVHELECTSYRPQMTILASREHTCIHAKASRAAKKNEACMRLLDEKNCSHYNNSKLLSRDAAFRPGGPSEIWDIEDLVTAGREHGACPYFAAREMAQRADLVFCPYNYVLSPSIRAALGIDLAGAVVIMDEAHNIEDVARDAGSTSIAADALSAIASDFASTLEHRGNKGAFSVRCMRLSDLARRMLEWIEATAEVVEFKRGHVEDPVGYAICDRAVLDAALAAWGASEAALATAAEDIRALITSTTPGAESDSGDDDDDGMNFVTRETLQLLSEVLVGVGYLVEGGGRFAGDFKLVLTSTRRGAGAGPRGAWRGRARGDGAPMLGLEIWCLNPAVVFGRLTASARSVILTSGTLAPLATFAAELGVAFGVQLECDHVVGPDQFVAAVLTHGVGGGELVATYRNTQTPAFLDTLGRTIAALCADIPAGVLVFMPSYALLRAASTRWRASGLLDELERRKRCFFEPASKQDGSFADLLAAYYAEAPAGAVLFAVYRGKASEGINFSDDNARGVLCVGIPYPSLGDAKVGAKYEFNKARAALQPGALGADAWYDTQAIRAVCQAMGRCLRHVNDRGAIILLDARYRQDRYRRLLSKWVRSALGVYTGPDLLCDRLRAFAAMHAPLAAGPAGPAALDMA